MTIANIDLTNINEIVNSEAVPEIVNRNAFALYLLVSISVSILIKVGSRTFPRQNHVRL